MKMTRVYDLPTRLFHWLFAGLFIAAFFIAKVLDDESAQYPYHMLLGLVLALSVVLRVVWGLLGSRHARFSSYVLNPAELIEYFKNFFSAKTKRYLGHNPASSWAAIIMMALALGLGVSGYLMVQGTNKELFEDIHELLANAFLVVAIAHVAGIILHTLKHKDAIGLSMVHGKKIGAEGDLELQKSHWLVALIFVGLIGSFVVHLNKNYDQSTQSLKLFGKTLQLGENEEAEGGAKGEGQHDEKDEDEDND